MAKSSANQPNETFHNEQTVWFRANPEVSGTITGIVTRPGGSVQYLVANGLDFEERIHFACEITSERPNLFGNEG